MISRRPSSLRQQRGLSLIVVMVIALLSVLLTLGTARLANFNEVRAGNDTDNQQAFEAAQAMIRDAQLDIILGSTTETSRSQGINVNDPERMADLLYAASVSTDGVKCAAALCSDLHSLVFGDPDEVFWNNPDLLKKFWDKGAEYGQYTTTTKPTSNANPRLTEAAKLLNAPPYVQGAKYWIEILRAADPTAGWAQQCVNSSSDANYLFRITAIAMGRAGKPAVVQEFFVLNPGGLDPIRRCPSE